MSEYNIICSLHEDPLTLDWCENNCNKYYICDTVAIVIELEAKQERGD